MDRNKNGRSLYILILLVMCLLSFGLGYFVFNKFQTKELRHIPINDSISINVIPLKPENINVKNTYVGYVEAINQVQIIPYVSGYIQKIDANKGQYVSEGDLLITINPDEYLAKLDSAKASVLQAKALLDYNENYFNRLKKSEKAFSEIEIDNAKNNFLQAKASYENALANLKFAEINYNYTIIKSPISGLIGNFNLSVGDYVSPAKGVLLNIVQTNPIRVVFSLTDVEYLDMLKDSDKLFKDSVIKLKTANGENFEYTGTFKYTDNTINKNTNSLSVYADFRNDKNKLLPNAFVTVEVYKDLKNVILIDKNYVKMKENGYFVNIAQNDKITQHKIKIITEMDNKYVVENSFESGDLLVLDDIKTSTTTNIKFNTLK